MADFNNLKEFKEWARKIEREVELLVQEVVQLKKDVKKQKAVVNDLADIFEEGEEE